MLKAVERSLDPCKPDSRMGLAGSDSATALRRGPRLLLWTTASIVLLMLAFAMDDQVSRIFTLKSSAFLKALALCASKTGEGWVIAVAGGAISIFLFFLQRFKASRLVFLVAGSGLLTGAAATILRSLFGRTRPDSSELQGFYGVWHDSHWIIGKYEFGAFPSGHAATVIGLATAAWLIDRRLGMLAAVYALLVSWSRIALGCHHFSDAVAAAILGIYGAHLIWVRLGPGVHALGANLQNAWLNRKRGIRTPADLGSTGSSR